MIKKLLDSLIKKACNEYTKPIQKRRFTGIPFYKNFGSWTLCVYAMESNWNSLRIKFEKDDCTKMVVIKKGKY